MEKYVDGYVLPLPMDKVEEYKRIAEMAGGVWREHGALEYWECVGDDLEVKDFTSFRNAAGAGGGETVIFSWIVFESREHRDRVNSAVMADPRLKEMMEDNSQLFDCRRMIYGGFRELVKS